MAFSLPKLTLGWRCSMHVTDDSNVSYCPSSSWDSDWAICLLVE